MNCNNYIESQNKTPIVSIVMCCFNGEQHIREAIDSVLGQTYENFEFIIWNDGSTDSTEEIINKYKDSRIKYFYHKNTGLGLALNMACNEAKGKYIARIDADDLCKPERIAMQVSYMESHKSVVLISCLAEYIGENGEFLGFAIPYTHPKILKKHLTCIAHPGVMMRKDAYDKTGGYPPLKRSQDLFLWNRICKFGEVRILELPLIQYRISDNAISSKASAYYIENVNELWRIVSNKPIIGEQDYDYLNLFIKENTASSNVRKSPVNTLENKLLRILLALFTPNIAFNIIVRLKNLYGLCFLL